MEIAEQVSGPLVLVRGLDDLDRLGGLDDYAREMTETTARLLAEGVDALEVTQAVAFVNDVLTSRLLELGEARLGPPPFAYSWLALGSHGRGEQVLSSDQDSALAYGGPRTAPGDPEEYFARLSELVVDALARAGIPRCTGGYMADSWRHPLSTYVEYFQRWVNDPLPADLLRAEIFLDVRPVHGSLDVSALDEILVAGGQRGSFLLQMARATVTFRPPLIVLGHLRTDHGWLDIKRSGTAAIVLLARLYSLAAGSSARTTVLRLHAAGAAGKLSTSGVSQLVDAYRLLTRLRLQHQVEQVRRGAVPDNRLRVDDLPGAERRRLREAIRTVRVLQEITANRYQTHTVT
ncbi:MAG TPA: putative nucleotidyltransferase substrate binding domain-containing protein [Nocardioidaceae bacterium]|nr:putative nucleotidyltransferase substrate binding domain-containing protein [Nocardioidaceae bacterium]